VHGDEVEEFWALREVSFEIKRGEVVGIIGRNGAGKSTLLKLLSRITEPTSGRIRLRGRVGSLLEVGTGFHAELTGRENVFLNGAILGMTGKDIARKFDGIVAFAEIEHFLDTLLFVSHNVSAINNLCTKGIYLDVGRLQEVGEAKAVVSKYLTSTRIDHDAKKNLVSETRSKHQKAVFFTGVSILNHKGEVSFQLEVTRSFYISMSYEYAHKTSGVELEIRIETADGVAVFSSAHLLPDPNFHGGLKAQQFQIRYVEIPAMFLMPGQYFVTIAAHTPMVQVHDFHQQILGFEIVDNGTSWAKYGHYRQIGVVMVDLPWKSTLDVKGREVAVSGV
jgi:lipopolysaccharide transport system ATP-binding protein